MRERKKVSVGEGYARWARAYDDYPNPLIMLEEPIVRGMIAKDALGGGAKKRILDVACGTGRHTLWIAEQGLKVTAVDPSSEMLAVAREKAKSKGEREEGLPSRIDWVEARAEQLPFDDGSFDIVLNALLMEHVPDIEPVLRETHRVLAPGGSFILSVYHPWFPMKGVPAHFASSTETTIEYELPTYVHLPSTYLRTLLDLKMTLTDIFEPLVDDALIARRPNMEKHRDHPLALIFRATK
jgi:ubiquinone/menaquinone biosynthesis C-methylase UbiE